MRSLIDLIEQGMNDEATIVVESVISERSLSHVTETQKRLNNLNEEEQEKSADDAVGTMDDPVLDPEFSKEYFYKRFKYDEEHEILLKRLGLGPSSPIVSYINGIRYEIFTTSKQAEKETIKYIKDGSFKKQEDKKEELKKEKAEAQQAALDQQAQQKQTPEDQDNIKDQKKSTNEVFDVIQRVVDQNIPAVVEFRDGTDRTIVVDEAKEMMEVFSLLNMSNQEDFLNRISETEHSYKEVLNVLLDRIRKGVI